MLEKPIEIDSCSNNNTTVDKSVRDAIKLRIAF